MRGTFPCGRRDRCRLLRRPVRKRRQRHFSAEPLVDPTADARPTSTPHRPAALNTRPKATAASTGGPATGSNGHRRYGQRCDSGFEVTGNPGAGSRAVRGSTETSCRLVDNVLTAYWDAGGPNASPRTIYAAGGVPCNQRATRCRGSLYILDCSPFDAGDWVTCRGGVNAVVHIY